MISLLLGTVLLEFWECQRGVHHLLDGPVAHIRTLVWKYHMVVPLSHFCAPRNVFEFRILAKVGANNPKHERQGDFHDNLRQYIGLRASRLKVRNARQGEVPLPVDLRPLTGIDLEVFEHHGSTLETMTQPTLISGICSWKNSKN